MSVASAAPPAPPQAAAVFGARLPLAVRYADLLCAAGLERGLLGPREAGRIWDRHLLNCAALAPLPAPGASVVDLGSGAGLPGIPLALARPDLTVTLLEPMQRRAEFLAECLALLDLGLAVVRARAEDEPVRADVVACRAVAPLARLLPMALHVLSPGGTLMALKGAGAAEELAAATRTWPRGSVRRASVETLGTGGCGATAVVVETAGRPARGRG